MLVEEATLAHASVAPALSVKVCLEAESRIGDDGELISRKLVIMREWHDDLMQSLGG